MTLARRLGAVAAVVALVAAVAGCGGGRESAGSFVTRILREEISGQWAAQWTELHPVQQKLITQDEYVLCSQRINTDIATGKEKIVVHKERDVPFSESGVPEHRAKLVTISVAGKAITATFRFHAILHGGRWAWVLGPAFLQAVKQGQCLDGSPLGSASSQASGASS